MTNDVTYKVKIEIVNGEPVIKLPQELIEKLKWAVNDEVEWEFLPAHAVLHKINK